MRPKHWVIIGIVLFAALEPLDFAVLAHNLIHAGQSILASFHAH